MGRGVQVRALETETENEWDVSEPAAVRAARNWFRATHSATAPTSYIPPEVRATIARKDAGGHRARRWSDSTFGCTCREAECAVAVNAEQLIGERMSDEDLPADPRARLLWRDALAVQQRHRSGEDGCCQQCGEPSPCAARINAARAISVATIRPPQVAVEDVEPPRPEAAIFTLTPEPYESDGPAAGPTAAGPTAAGPTAAGPTAAGQARLPQAGNGADPTAVLFA